MVLTLATGICWVRTQAILLPISTAGILEVVPMLMYRYATTCRARAIIEFIATGLGNARHTHPTNWSCLHCTPEEHQQSSPVIEPSQYRRHWYGISLGVRRPSADSTNRKRRCAKSVRTEQYVTLHVMLYLISNLG